MKICIRIFLAVILLGPIAPAFADEALKETIQIREVEWAAAFNAGDTAGVAALYEEDAVLLAPGGPPVHGNVEIAEVLSGLFGVLQNIRLVTEEVRPIGDDYAIEIGRVEYEVAGADGTSTFFTGNYVVNWHMAEDGVWRYVSDIFNERHSETIAE
jgi:uncharacterized protein (TIGR02246 family)